MDRYLHGNSPRPPSFPPNLRTPDLPLPPSPYTQPQLPSARSLPSRNSPMPPYVNAYHLHSDFERSQSWPSADKFNQEPQRGNFLSPNLSTPPPQHHISPHMPSVSPRSYSSDIEEPSTLLKYGIISRAASSIHASPAIRHHGIDIPKKSSDFLFPSSKERPPSAFSPRAFSPGGFSVPSPFSPSGGFSPSSFSPGSIAESYYQAASKYGAEMEEQTAPLKLKISPKRELDFSDQEEQPRDLRKNSFSERWSPSPLNLSNDANQPSPSQPSPRFPYGMRLPPKKAWYGYTGANPSPGSTSSSTSDRQEQLKNGSPAPQLQLPRIPSPVQLRILQAPAEESRVARWAEIQQSQTNDPVPVQMLPDFAPPSKVLHHRATPVKNTSPAPFWAEDRFYAQRNPPPSLEQIWPPSQYLPPTHVDPSVTRLVENEIFSVNPPQSENQYPEPVYTNNLVSKEPGVPKPKRGRPKKVIQADPVNPGQPSPPKKRGKKKTDLTTCQGGGVAGRDDDGAASPVLQVKYVPPPMIQAGKLNVSKNVLDLILSKKKASLLTSPKVAMLISELSRSRVRKK